jgi:uncharacterized membrane protein
VEVVTDGGAATGGGMRLGARLVCGLFAVSGVTHVVRPDVFDALLPRALPARRGLVVASGVAELACAAGLATRQRWAPRVSAGLLLAVWPGNWYQAWRAQTSPDVPATTRALLWVRVPLQVPMVRWVLRPGRDRHPDGT